MKNWRPISLLNSDYKILAKLLAKRLQNVISNIINTDQVGYIKGRFIGENTRAILDIIEITKNLKDHGLMFFIDVEKAFDTLNWNYLLRTLQYFNFGAQFQKWIKILYTSPLCCVTNNGYATDFFELEQGIRQ